MDNNILKEYYDKAKMFYSEGKYTEAAKYFTKIIELMPKSPKIYYNRGLTFCQIAGSCLLRADTDVDGSEQIISKDKNRFGSASREKITETDCEREMVYETMHKNIPIKKYALRHKESDNDSSEVNYEDKNNEDAQEKNIYYQKAIKDFTNAIRIDQAFAEAYYNLGGVYLNTGEYELAIENYNYVIALKPFYVDAYNNRGFAYYNMKEYVKAIEDYSHAVEIDPKNAVVYNNRGNAYDDMGEYRLAIEDYTKAIETDQTNIESRYNRGIAYYRNRNYKNAIHDFMHILNNNKSDTDSLCYIALSYFMNKEYNNALIYFKKLSEISEEDIAYLYIAKIYNLQKEYDKALYIYSMLIEKAEYKNANLYYERGLVYINKNEYEEAVKDLDKAISLDNHFDLAYYQREIIIKKMKEKE